MKKLLWGLSWMLLFSIFVQAGYAGTVSLQLININSAATLSKVTIQKLPSPWAREANYYDFVTNDFDTSAGITAGNEQGTTTADSDIVTVVKYPASSAMLQLTLTTDVVNFTAGAYLITIYDTTLEVIGIKTIWLNNQGLLEDRDKWVK